MSEIIPTVGRVMWYYANSEQSEPLAAMVARVWTPQTVNLMVIDSDGHTGAVTSVAVVQDDTDKSAVTQYPYCTWMPYQRANA